MGGGGADGARGDATGGLSQPEEHLSSAQQRHSYRDHNCGASRKARKEEKDAHWWAWVYFTLKTVNIESWCWFLPRRRQSELHFQLRSSCLEVFRSSASPEAQFYLFSPKCVSVSPKIAWCMDSMVQFPLQLIAHFVFLFASNVIYSVLQVAISRGAVVNHSSPDAQKKSQAEKTGRMRAGAERYAKKGSQLKLRAGNKSVKWLLQWKK